MLKIGIILGSTRPNRVGPVVANWVQEIAAQRTDAEFELVDIAEQNLPLLDAPLPPLVGQYANQHTTDWAAKVESFDAYVFVTPEYNHSVPAALKNAVDYVHAEWNNKAAGFVSYGAAGGIRAVEALRLILAELKIATVRAQVTLDSYQDFENFYDFKPTERHVAGLNTVFDEVIAWGAALRTLRDRP